MFVDLDKDNSLADDLFTVIERAIEEERHDIAAVLGATWAAIHENRTRQLAAALGPFIEERLTEAAEIRALGADVREGGMARIAAEFPPDGDPEWERSRPGWEAFLKLAQTHAEDDCR